LTRKSWTRRSKNQVVLIETPMKVFISWSGKESHAVAQVLRTQLPCIINAVKPFVSSEDIDKGAAWFQTVGTELEKSDFGIICLTGANQENKWVLFEAGALAGKFTKGRIAPLLIDTTPAAIKPPLSQFQLTDVNNREDFFKLLLSINACLGENTLSQEILKESFDNWWSAFNQKVKAAIASVPKMGVKEIDRSPTEILEEILGIVRSLRRSQPPTSRYASILATAMKDGDGSLRVEHGGDYPGDDYVELNVDPEAVVVKSKGTFIPSRRTT